MTNKKTLIEFPCIFPIKIIGNNTPNFENEIINIAQEHDPSLMRNQVRTQLSNEGKYRSLSITVNVQDQQSLDALYQALTKHPEIKMVL